MGVEAFMFILSRGKLYLKPAECTPGCVSRVLKPGLSVTLLDSLFPKVPD